MDLKSTDELTIAIRSIGIRTWDELKSYVRALPYGRNTNRKDLSLVISEKRGTCSSKHAFLKLIAKLNNIPNVELILCLYKMKLENTPGIGNYLKEAKLTYIPEAHCYLVDHGINLDLTNKNSTITRIEDDIIEEISIASHEVSEFKVNYHKDYLMQWIIKERIPLSFDQIWSTRELCIASLADN